MLSFCFNHLFPAKTSSILLYFFTFSAYFAVVQGQVVCSQDVLVQDEKGVDEQEKSTPTEDQSETSETEEAPAAGFDLEANLKSFDQVWETVATTHWDEALIAEKWEPLKDKYRPQVESAKTIGEVRRVIQSMIGELELSHFAIIQASAFNVIRPSDRPGDASAGMQFRRTEDGVVVWQVSPESSAAEAGVEPGWIVEKIGEQDMAELLEEIQAAARGPIRAETLVGLVLAELANGPPGDLKTFQFIDRDSEVQEKKLELREREGQFTTFGNLPPIRVEMRAETLTQGIGYFWFNAFLDPIRLMPQFRSVVHADENHAGIVLDLRGNMGGMAGITMGMASEFSDSPAALGTMTMRGTEIKFFVNANANPVSCPVAVLVDECSISSAEILAGGLQDLKLAKLFGSRTAGLALPSVVVRLPNGDGFQYAMANYHSASGMALEMNGVTPDESITLTREGLLTDPDPVLSRAVSWILEQNANRE